VAVIFWRDARPLGLPGVVCGVPRACSSSSCGCQGGTPATCMQQGGRGVWVWCQPMARGRSTPTNCGCGAFLATRQSLDELDKLQQSTLWCCLGGGVDGVLGQIGASCMGGRVREEGGRVPEGVCGWQDCAWLSSGCEECNTTRGVFGW
jgi:hypothetical protein